MLCTGSSSDLTATCGLPAPRTRHHQQPLAAEALLCETPFHVLPLRVHMHVHAGFISAIPVASKINLPRAWEAVDGTSICEPVRSDLSQAHPYRRVCTCACCRGFVVDGVCTQGWGGWMG